MLFLQTIITCICLDTVKTSPVVLFQKTCSAQRVILCEIIVGTLVKTAVSAYFTSKQTLHFSFARQNRLGPYPFKKTTLLMLAHRLRSWPNIKPILGQRFVFFSVSHHHEIWRAPSAAYRRIPPIYYRLVTFRWQRSHHFFKGWSTLAAKINRSLMGLLRMGRFHGHAQRNPSKRILTFDIQRNKMFLTRPFARDMLALNLCDWDIVLDLRLYGSNFDFSAWNSMSSQQNVLNFKDSFKDCFLFKGLSHFGDQSQRSPNARWRALTLAGPSFYYRHVRLAIALDRRWTLMIAESFQQVQSFQRTSIEPTAQQTGYIILI